MVQVPVVTMVAVVPLTVQTLVVCELKATVKPEVEVATSVNGVPMVCVPGLLKVMVWFCFEPDAAEKAIAIAIQLGATPSVNVPLPEV